MSAVERARQTASLCCTDLTGQTGLQRGDRSCSGRNTPSAFGELEVDWDSNKRTESSELIRRGLESIQLADPDQLAWGDNIMADVGGLPLPKYAQVTPTHSADASGIVA
ncbi:hypothetical protein NQZ68_013693 [Dissostichus eleginoides]|nr:hypothetical protein NQZ68_013693 [Dissostichus eleginoides]